MVRHGFYAVSKLTFAMEFFGPSVKTRMDGEMERWRREREKDRIARQPVQYLLEFKCCVEKESWTNATNGQVKTLQEREEAFCCS